MNLSMLILITPVTLLNIFIGLSSIKSLNGSPILSPLASLLPTNNTAPSLSELISYKSNSTIEYLPYPPRPTCESLLNVEEKQYAVSVSTWRIDINDKRIQGILMWKEEVKTSCTFTFFGSKTRVTLGSKIVPFGPIPSADTIIKYMSTNIDEITEYPQIPEDLKFYCYYCRNDYTNTYYRTLYKHVVISRYPEGDIRSPLGNWGHVTKNFYTDGLRFLYIHKSDSNNSACPFLIHEIRSGVLSLSQSDTMLISIPSIKQQYSIPQGSDSLICKSGDSNYVLWHTAGGYIISFSGTEVPMSRTVLSLLKGSSRTRRDLKNTDIIFHRYTIFNLNNKYKLRRHLNRMKRYTPDIMEFSSHLRSDLIYSQFRYEMNFVLKQINRNLILIQNNICEYMLTRWSSLYPPDLPRKVAQYSTHSPFPIGEFKDGIYKITHTVNTYTPIHLVIPLHRVCGMYQVINDHTNDTLWVEPITGILFKIPVWTHYSMVATWLPTLNGSGIDPLTGRLVSSEALNTPLSLIEQAEAYYPKTLYTQGSMAGILEDNNFYNSPSSPGFSSSISTEWWGPWLSHIVIGAISLILSLILIPVIMRLLSSCAFKGEEVIEKTLHLSPKHQLLIPTKD